MNLELLSSFEPTYSWDTKYFPQDKWNDTLREWSSRPFYTNKKLEDLGSRIIRRRDKVFNSRIDEIKNRSGFYMLQRSVYHPILKDCFKKVEEYGWGYHWKRWELPIGFNGVPSYVWDFKVEDVIEGEGDMKYVVILPSIDTINWLNKVAKLVDSSYIVTE